MKCYKIIASLMLAVATLAACSSDNDDARIRIDAPANGFTFTPYAGGAVMHYVLPENDQITGITVTYNDEYGRKVRCSGSATCDSVQLVGFNHATENVSAQVAYIMRDQSESEPFNVTFNTKNSAPVEFLNTVNAVSNWSGFSLTFTNNAESKGMVHVFYLGVDPLSQKADTILKESFYLEQEEDVQVKNYRMQQDVGNNVTVVVRAEDFRGNMVGEKSWNNVPLLEESLSKWNTDFKFYCDNVVVDDIGKVGTEYLFDGDLTGISQTKKENLITSTTTALCTFIAGPDAEGDNAHPMYFDMQKNRILANLRIYAMLHWYDYKRGYLSPDLMGEYYTAGSYLYYYNDNETPCDVTVYGMKDNGASVSSYDDMNNLSGEWEEIGSYYESPSSSYKTRWCPEVASGQRYSYSYVTTEDFEKAEPEYMEIVIPASTQGEGYRYIKVVINDTYNSSDYYGLAQYENAFHFVNMQEMEIRVAKDN